MGYAYENRETTAERLKLGRMRLGIRQDELGEKLGVRRSTISRRERNLDGAMPEDPWNRAYLLEQLADLGVDREVLGLPAESSLVVETDSAPNSTALAEAEAEAAKALRRLQEAIAQVQRQPD